MTSRSPDAAQGSEGLRVDAAGTTADERHEAVEQRPSGNAAHVFDFREIADYVVENEDTATAANALRNAQDEIDRLRGALIAISAVPYEAVGGKRAHELSMKALHRGR